MNVGSLFTGIGGFDLGLERAGHRIVFQCESDPYRRRVLARHWPGVPCFEDVRLVHGNGGGVVDRGRSASVGGGDRQAVDLLCGGFPCQDLSVAGRRAGLAGERSGLFFEFARIADDLLGSGGWLLIENVPGLLSSHGGRDFAVLLSTLAELGFHDLAWRVLDSRYLGVPQRRRRVFILARRARGRSASEVLLEPESGGGDFETGREARERIATRSASGPLTSRYGAGGGKPGQGYPAILAHTLSEGDSVQSRSELGNSQEADPNGVRAPSGVPGRVDGPVSFHTAGYGASASESETATLQASDAQLSNQIQGVIGSGEGTDRCAFDPKPDGPRYAACGDAVTVQCAEWIGRRLVEYG